MTHFGQKQNFLPGPMSKLALIFPQYFYPLFFRMTILGIFQSGLFGSQNWTNPIDWCFLPKRKQMLFIVILFSCWIKPTKTLERQFLLPERRAAWIITLTGGNCSVFCAYMTHQRYTSYTTRGKRRKRPSGHLGCIASFHIRV